MTNDDLDAIRARLRACEAALQARSLGMAELLAELEKAQTAQKTWTEIGAKAEARLVVVVEAARAAIDRWADEEEPTAFESEMSALAFRVNGQRWDDDAPLLVTAQQVVAAWDKLGECEDEFADYDPAGTCAEWRDALDGAILALKGLLEGERGASAAEMPAPRLVTDQTDHERLGE